MNKYLKNITFLLAAVASCVIIVFSMTAYDSEKIEDPIASVKFSLSEPLEWYSYPPIPTQKDEAPEKLSKHVYGSLVEGIKTPKTRNFCVWRDGGGTLYAKNLVRPDYIFLTCVFGPKIQRYEPESFILEDVLVTRFGWSLSQDSYQMDRLEVEVYGDVGYRSQNLQPDMKDININVKSIQYPKTKNDPMFYDLEFNLPARANSGQSQTQPIVNFEFKGTALPMPNWVNY